MREIYEVIMLPFYRCWQKTWLSVKDKELSYWHQQQFQLFILASVFYSYIANAESQFDFPMKLSVLQDAIGMLEKMLDLLVNGGMFHLYVTKIYYDLFKVIFYKIW